MIETETERQNQKQKQKQTKKWTQKWTQLDLAVPQVLHVAGCRLQVASCNLKDVAFAAHLTPKSQNENGTRPRLGQGHKQEQLQEGEGRERGWGDSQCGPEIYCITSWCSALSHDAVIACPGCPKVVLQHLASSSRSNRRGRATCSMQHGACSRANIFESAARCGWRCRRKICGQQNGNGCGALAYAAMCHKKRQLPRVPRVAGTRYLLLSALHSPGHTLRHIS